MARITKVLTGWSVIHRATPRFSGGASASGGSEGGRIADMGGIRSGVDITETLKKRPESATTSGPTGAPARRAFPRVSTPDRGVSMAVRPPATGATPEAEPSERADPLDRLLEDSGERRSGDPPEQQHE